MKDNQPRTGLRPPQDLRAAIADASDDTGVSPRERRLAEAERQTASSVDKGHGRLEKRTLTSTTSLSTATSGHAPCPDWPHPGQCFKPVRERTVNTKDGPKTTTETVFGITSLTRGQADATRLLKLVRSHWSVEALFHVRSRHLRRGRLPRLQGRRTRRPFRPPQRRHHPARPGRDDQ